MTERLKPTAEQEAIVEQISSPESLMIEAGAGCAKTSTLQMAAPQVRVPALALAFNKKIAEELKPRLPGNFQVLTLNGMGHKALSAGLGRRLVLDDRKLGKLVTQVSKDRRCELTSDQWDGLRGQVSRAMLAGIVPGPPTGQSLEDDTDEAWIEAGMAHGLDEDGAAWGIDLAREILDRNNTMTKEGIISFDDQVYGSVCLGGRFPQFPVVFVDESQDLSPLNHEMLRRAMRPDGKLVAVGDRRQAIYAFRGAVANSMDVMRDLRKTWADRPLMMTFRCPKLVVARQQEHVPGFRAFEGNAEGRVERFRGEWKWEDVQELQTSTGKLGTSVAILCRNNAPIMEMAFKLLRRGVGVHVLGKDLGKRLVGLIRKIGGESDLPRDLFLARLRDWEETQISIARLKDDEAKMDAIRDQAEALGAVLEHSGARGTAELEAVLVRLFAAESGVVTLATGHKAKGLEWDLVVHLDPWRIPAKWARGEGRSQELNLRYVIETRTRHTLIEANLEDFR